VGLHKKYDKRDGKKKNSGQHPKREEGQFNIGIALGTAGK